MDKEIKEMLGENTPLDWGIADKTEWVASQPFESEARMPALEGRDVVGFSESISFAVELAPNKPPGVQQWTDKDGRPVKLNPQTKSWYHIDKSGQKDLRNKLQKSAPEKPQKPPLRDAPPRKPEPAAPKETSQKEQQTPSDNKRSIGKDFSLELTETNEQFLQKIQAQGRANGTEFVDLRKLIGEQSSIPPRHLDALSRMLVTQGSDTTPWSDFGGDVRGGAGKIYAQAGELMALAFSSLPAEQSKKLQTAISDILAAQKAAKTKKQIITPAWFQAAQDNTIAVNNGIKSNNDENVSIIGGAWDVKDEVEELGMNDYDSEKGFSTDIYLGLSDNSLAQVSLKKDTRVNFLNSGAGSYSKFIISAHAKNPSSPYYEQAKAYFEAKKIKDSIAKNLPPKVNAPRKKDGADIVDKWNKAIETISQTESEDWAKPDDSYNNQVYSKKEETRLREVLSSHGDKIKEFDVRSIPTDSESILIGLYKDEGIDPKEIALGGHELNRLVKTGEISADDRERILRAKETVKELKKEANVIASENQKLIDKAIKTMEKSNLNWSELVDLISTQKGLNRDNRKLIHMAALNQDIPGYRESVQTSHKEFVSAAINAIRDNPEMREGMLEELKQNFPIRDVAEGKEIMAIGDLSFDTKTCRHIFGTNDFDTIKTGFKVTTDENGVPYLGWVGKAGEGPILPLAKINVRQDGVGYGGGNIKHEMVLHPDFANRLRQANAHEYGAGSGRTFSETEFEEPLPSKKPTYEDYLKILRSQRSSQKPSYSDSMVFYKGKALGRCPAGTTRSGKTCIPAASPANSAAKYKTQDIGGLSPQQVRALSKAKTTQDVLNAHKKQN